jgi:hypothetical protein
MLPPSAAIVTIVAVDVCAISGRRRSQDGARRSPAGEVFALREAAAHEGRGM